MEVLLVRLLFQTGECESIRVPVGQEDVINLLDGNSRILRQGPFLVSFKPDLSKAFVPAGLKLVRGHVDDIPRLFIFQGAFIVAEYINFSENDVIDIHVLNESGKIQSAFVKFA
jgi:hypothetical protein